MKLTNSPVDSINLFGREIFIKRDDLLHPEFSGNKARKFKYLLDNDFPDIKQIVAYGSCQANSLYSLSALTKLRGWKFLFYVIRIPQHLKDNPLGNYAAALKNGAEIKPFPQSTLENNKDKEDWLNEIYGKDRQILVIPEGGRCELSRYGVYELAAEIRDWARINKHEHLKIFLPSGTGTTALFLQEFFSNHCLNIQVITCAAVGNSAYLQTQFDKLNSDRNCHPKILPTPQRFHFGKLNRKLFDVWKVANHSGIEFELLYDPIGLITLEAHIKAFECFPMLYIHQGGLLANETMLLRFKRKYGI